MYLNAISQEEVNKIWTIKGIYKGSNLYLRNPFGSGGVGFCAKNVKVNGQSGVDTKGSVIEINFPFFKININDSVIIEIEHDPYCKPGILNEDDILNNQKPNFNSKSLLIHGVILDELSKVAVNNVNLITINKINGAIVSYVSPGVSDGTYNIIVNWGDLYEITFIAKDENFNDVKNFPYSIKKILIDLRGIPNDGSFNYKTKIDVEFLLSRKINSEMDTLLAKLPISKLAYNSFYKELRWDEEYSSAITAATSNLIKQIQKQKELNEKIVEVNQEQTQKKYLFVIIAFVELIMIISIIAFFRQKKLKELVNLRKEEIEKQKHLIEEKQKEILDSIRYAKRIQTALLTSEKYIDRSLNKLSKSSKD